MHLCLSFGSPSVQWTPEEVLLKVSPPAKPAERDSSVLHDPIDNDTESQIVVTLEALNKMVTCLRLQELFWSKESTPNFLNINPYAPRLMPLIPGMQPITHQHQAILAQAIANAPKNVPPESLALANRVMDLVRWSLASVVNPVLMTSETPHAENAGGEVVEAAATAIAG